MNSKKRNYQLQLIDEQPYNSKQQNSMDKSNSVVGEENDIKSAQTLSFDQILSERIRFGKIQYKSLVMMGKFLR